MRNKVAGTIGEAYLEYNRYVKIFFQSFSGIHILYLTSCGDDCCICFLEIKDVEQLTSYIPYDKSFMEKTLGSNIFRVF